MNLRYIVLTVLAIILIPIGITFGGFYSTYSDGFRVGEIQKASYKGILFKSFEGQLVLDGFKNKASTQGSTMVNTWDFSAVNKEIADQLRTLGGHKVKLTYNQWLIRPMTQDTHYTIVKVEELK